MTQDGMSRQWRLLQQLCSAQKSQKARKQENIQEWNEKRRIVRRKRRGRAFGLMLWNGRVPGTQRPSCNMDIPVSPRSNTLP